MVGPRVRDEGFWAARTPGQNQQARPDPDHQQTARTPNQLSTPCGATAVVRSAKAVCVAVTVAPINAATRLGDRARRVRERDIVILPRAAQGARETRCESLHGMRGI
jgi:hypothetical protein